MEPAIRYSMSLMELISESNPNILELTGAYDPQSQTWKPGPESPSLRTNYQTVNRTQRQTMNHTAPNDHIPDFPDDTEMDFAQD